MNQPIQLFINRWQASGAAERANYQLFLAELCDVIGVAHPQPAVENPHENAYVFEKRVPSAHGTTNFIDLYKRSCFVLEAKQGSDKADSNRPEFSEAALLRRQQRKTGTAVRGTKSWDTAMEKALQQAQTYARSLPSDEIADGRPPFIIVVDVGNSIALYSEFSRTGGNYIPFPDPSSYRLKLDDLLNADKRKLLKQVWDDPMSLDPSRRSARVTREIAARLAALARSLEGNAEPETVVHFLMRCLFTMFAEDVGLLPERGFTQLLDDMRHDPASFQPMLEHLWQTMNTGGFSVILRRQIPKFNGGLFAEPKALPLTLPQIELLVEAAKADWRDVEPAIFGTLLERALNPIERHKLGAHYTPRAYVERLVQPTIIEPLRDEWNSVKTAAALYADAHQPDKAVAEVETFHRRLATIRILDPACGSGNFLYVALEQLKRLEGEVLNTLGELGEGQMKLEMAGITVSPQQFLGIEVNPRAAAIAELVLWIGYLQWHYRTRGSAPHAEPIIKDFHNIECRDAVLAWDRVEPLLDENGRPVTRWDGRSTKLHPITGEPVPDETARIPAYKYINPRPATWPDADFVVGNPPFIGSKRMREALGDAYIDAIQAAWPQIPQATDFVSRWWHHAAELTRNKQVERFGLITTNSLRQTYNRRVIEPHLNDKKNPLSIIFAIPDHPWVDSADGAAVRVSMTTGIAGKVEGELVEVSAEWEESANESGDLVRALKTKKGFIHSDLTIGANISDAFTLEANSNLCAVGVKTIGNGFVLEQILANSLGYHAESLEIQPIRPYLNGRDLASTSRNVFVIDFYGTEEKEVYRDYPEIYQYLLNNVKPYREVNRNSKFRELWWIIGHPRPIFREFTNYLSRYIVTIETSKHRFFTFLPKSVLPDSTLVTFGFDDAYILGVLSSSIHVKWSLVAGGTLEDRPRYFKSTCFEKFPFPDASEAQKARIRALAEQLDAHRKRQQAQHPSLTLTDMYNVLEKVRALDLSGGAPPDRSPAPQLSAKEKQIYEQGLIAILKQLHDDLDEAVFAAYGWPSPSPSTSSGGGVAEPVEAMTDEDILQHLVDLNAERAAEEANGRIRWLRPGYQAPEAAKPQQAALLDVSTPDVGAQRAAPLQVDWPKALKDRATAVRAVLAGFGSPVSVEQVAGGFNGRSTPKRLTEVGEILEMLAALGQVVEREGKFAPT